MEERLAHVVQNFAGRRIAILGDMMLDEYTWGHVTRISPEAPVPVLEVVEESYVLGGAGNVLTNVKALGGHPLAFGVAGDDDPGRKLLDAIAIDGWGGRHHVLVDPSRPTTVKRRIVAHNQHVVRVDRESRRAISESLRKALLDRLSIELPQVEVLVVSDYAKGVLTREFFDRVLRLALAANVPLLLDPKAFDLRQIGPVMAVTPNEREAEKFSGISIHDRTTVEDAGRMMIDQTGAKHVLITRGEHGMALFSRSGDPVHLPTRARQVYDVTGAGDTAIAVLSMAVAAGASMPEAARLANLGAGVVVGKVGTATISQDDLLAALAGEWPVDAPGGKMRPG